MSQNATVWLAFVLGGLLTYLQRASFILFLGRRSLPPPVQRALRYVAPAAFAAIVAPRVLTSASLTEFTAPDARLLAAFVGGVVMWKVKKLPVMLVVGNGDVLAVALDGSVGPPPRRLPSDPVSRRTSDPLAYRRDSPSIRATMLR